VLLFSPNPGNATCKKLETRLLNPSLLNSSLLTGLFQDL
jgi:hypothetical protein